MWLRVACSEAAASRTCCNQQPIIQGWADGTISNFPGMGDEGVDSEPADVQVVLETAADSRWQRDGSTLIYTAQISLCEALTNTIVEVRFSRNRQLSSNMNLKNDPSRPFSFQLALCFEIPRIKPSHFCHTCRSPFQHPA